MMPDKTLEQSPRRRRIAKARWAILRNALLHHADEQQQNHSIHRFDGYKLLQGRPVNSLELSRIESSLSEYRWNFSQGLDKNLHKLSLQIVALSACFPKGKCIRVISEYRSSGCWLISLQKRCQPSVGVWTVKEEEVKGEKLNNGDSSSSTNDIITSTLTTTTLLVRETSTSTKYRTLLYDLVDSNNDNSINENHYYVNNNKNTKDGKSLVTQDGYPPPFLRFIWTREPKEKRLSLDDLVSHRSNKGVDNTGNICVWDSEKTLTFLLYNYFDDFFTLTNTGVIGNDNYDNKNTIVSSCHDDDDSNDDEDGCDPEYEHNDIKIGISPDEDDYHHSEIRIMELGTGMAGMAAVALGFRVEMLLQQQQQYNRTDDECGDNKTTEENHENKNKRMPVHIVLTDGNPDGVMNNSINQYMTRLSSQIWQKQEIGNIHSCHHSLNINCEFLLWTTNCGNDIDGDDSNQLGKEQRRRQHHRYQDVILVSDCVHFQTFHAALAITTFQCLRVGGTAIFCQPTRGPSLDNFLNLLLSKTRDQPERKSSLSSRLSQSNNSLKKNNSPLLRCSWLTHPIVEQKHQEACSKHNDVYDENLHRPKILVTTKLREISEEDRLRFIAYQQQYSPTKPTID